ncbi:long-chain fatty acid transporter [Rhodanobacter thiooxydans]|uniref:Long-chain fatty acid transporter n=1 Tax=Rhodanobacter thiooxydans TaxID=416169 RepID=A0A154QFQ5_9GAMM|nr:outer membrane protein transport protein [Rhodanobacter thiooxydans]EIL96900.1 long-chain fatty acid transport protein [Rhodanobacter thiooxydans LCS2]KZC23122.1 long-chain fatty acid transporter [Rhodanobacter thiooxydans]MCW0201124.1 outer membrane protein transport protein [Rhodanobacter thiooxydans]
MQSQYSTRFRSDTCRATFRRTALLIALASVASGAHATDGYFTHGYGMQASGRGGASLAFTDNAFGGANNPATMVFSGNRLELGLTAFTPRRSASRSGLGPGLDGSVSSNRKWFGIPEFGYNHMLSDQLALGVTVYGNGGMDTDYPGGTFNCGMGSANMLCGQGHLGVDLMQLVVAPTVAYAITPRQSIGVSPLFVYQSFKAFGLQAFAGTPGLSADPSRVTDKGRDSSTGGGLRLGYYARLSDDFSIGATYAMKVRMSRFSDYAGLFAERGRFDIPSNYGAGFAWTPSRGVKLALDYMRINYSDVPAVGDSSLRPTQLGSANGPGFGWQDVNVWKLGAEWASSDRWTWRAGYNHTGNPIRGSDVTFNILAPGVVTNHVTLGFTHKLASGNELTMAYMHAFTHSVSGASILPVFMGGMPAGTEKISMREDSLGIQYAWK